MVFGGKADAVPGSVEDLRFDEGVRMGSWGLLLHSITGEALSLFSRNSVVATKGCDFLLKA